MKVNYDSPDGKRFDDAFSTAAKSTDFVGIVCCWMGVLAEILRHNPGHAAFPEATVAGVLASASSTLSRPERLSQPGIYHMRAAHSETAADRE